MVPGFLGILKSRSALAELGSTTGCFETVLLTFLHTRIAGEEASLLQGSTQFRISLAQGTRDAVTNCAGLTGHTTAADIHQHVERGRAGQRQGLTNGHLEGLQTEVVINITLVDGHFAITGDQADAGNSLLAAANSAVINLSHLFFSFPPYTRSNFTGFCAAWS